MAVLTGDKLKQFRDARDVKRKLRGMDVPQQKSLSEANIPKITIPQQQPTYSWSGKSASDMSTLEKVAFLRTNTDKNTARDAFAALSQEMQSVGSRHYSPYLSDKTNQKEAAAFFGVNSFDQNWLNANRGLLEYTNQLDLTDTVSTSGQKKWNQAQWAGYYYQTLMEAEQTTQDAESEWEQLRADMQRNFREHEKLYGEAPSYDKLMSYINMGDYSTLRKMDGVYSNIENLVRLNRPVNYTPETVQGVYAALKNGNDVTGDDNYFEYAVQQAMQPVQQTQERVYPDVEKEGYFGGQTLDEAFFDKYSYLNEYVEEMKDKDGDINKPNQSDPWYQHAAYEYHELKEREEVTVKAETELADLQKQLSRIHDDELTVQDALDYIDWSDYPTLKKLRDGDKVRLNRSVDVTDEAVGNMWASMGQQEAVTASEEPQEAQEEKNEDSPTVTPVTSEEGGEKGWASMPAWMRNREQQVEEKEGTPAFAAMPAWMKDQNGPVIREDTAADEALAASREQELKDSLADMTANTKLDALTIRKEFYDTHGRHMTMEEMAQRGIAPETMPEISSEDIVLGEMGTREKASIFDDQLNRIAKRYENTETGKAYENMDELIANDPALLADILVFANTDGKNVGLAFNAGFTTDEIERLTQLNEYYDLLEKDSADELMRAYADKNGVAEDRLNAALNYVIESGLTIRDKTNLGIANQYEQTAAMTDTSREVFTEKGNETMRSMALSLLSATGNMDAPEAAVDAVTAGLSNMFAVTTGVAAGVMKAPATAFQITRDVWAAANGNAYRHQLGGNYTLDQACEIDPILRALSDEADRAQNMQNIAAPDMSGYKYGAAFTREFVEYNTSQKVNIFFGSSMKDSITRGFKSLGLDISKLNGSDKPLTRIFGKLLEGTFGATPWMLQTMAASTQEARELGTSEAQAFAYGIFKAATTGLIEGFVGQAYDGVSGKAVGWLGKVIDGSIKNQTVNHGVHFMTNLLSQALGESVEELAEMPLDKVGRHVYLGEGLTITGEDWSETWSGMKQSFGTSVLTSLFFGLTADVDSKIYTDSEQLAQRIASGQVTIEDLMTYNEAAAEAGASPYLARDSMRIIQENQAQMDEAVIEQATEEAVQEQIAQGATKDIDGDASANMQAIRTMEAGIQEQEAIVAKAEEDLAANREEKRKALYDMISNGVSPEKGAARQMMYNFDEAAAAIVRKSEEATEKLAGFQKQLELRLQQVDAELAERTEELRKQNRAQIQQNFNMARQRADEAIVKSLEALKPSEPEEANRAEDDKRDVNPAVEVTAESIWAQELWGENDEYAPYSARNKENPEYESQDEANRQAHYNFDDVNRTAETVDDYTIKYAGLVQRGFHVEDGSAYGELEESDFAEIPEGQYKTFQNLIKRLEKYGVRVPDEHLRTTRDKSSYDDPIRKNTNGEYSTAARSTDGQYTLIVNNKAWDDYNEKRAEYDEQKKVLDAGLKDAKERLKEAEADTDAARREAKAAQINQEIEQINNSLTALKKDEPKSPKGTYMVLDNDKALRANRKTPVEKRAESIIQGIDARIGDLTERNAQLAEQGIDGVDIDQTDVRIEVLTKLRNVARDSGYRRFIAQVEHLLASDAETDSNRRKLLREELNGILSDVPDEASFGRTEKQTRTLLQQLMIGYRDNSNQAIDLLETITRGGYEDYRSEPKYYVSNRLAEVLDDYESYVYTPDGSDERQFDIRAFERDHPGLFFGLAQQDEEENNKPKREYNPLLTPYKSLLHNPKYALVDKAGKVGMIVKQDGGSGQVNIGVNSIQDAIRMTDELISKEWDRMAQEAMDGREGNHNPYRIVYSTMGEDGELVNHSYLDYVDPNTGRKRLPTMRELLEISERVTVNWAVWGNYAEGKLPDNTLSFTLEMIEPLKPLRSFEEATEALHKAEAEYDQHAGSGSRADKLRYFEAVCDANYNAYIARIVEMGRRLESGTVTDAECDHIRRSMEEMTAAVQTWRYMGDRVRSMTRSESEAAIHASGMDKVMAKYEQLLKDGGNASMAVRMALTATMQRSLRTHQVNALKATIPQDATIQSLEAQKAELQQQMQQLMEQRNKANDLSGDAVSALNNEPLVEAVERQIDVVDAQIAVMEEGEDVQTPVEPQQPETPVSEAIPEEAEAPAEEEAQNGAQEVTETAETTVPTTETTAETTGTAVEQPAELSEDEQREAADRAYLEAMVNPASAEPDSANPVSDEGTPEDQKPEGGEQKEYNPEIEADDLSYDAPVEEYAKRAGLRTEYGYIESINSLEMHNTIDETVTDAYKAVRSLTGRIDEMADYVHAMEAEAPETAAIRERMQEYIALRNQIKLQAKEMDKALAESPYMNKATVKACARYALEKGVLDWEIPANRARNIKEIRELDMEGVRARLNEVTGGDRTMPLNVADLEYILKTDTMDSLLKRRHQIAIEIYQQLSDISREVTRLEDRRQMMLDEIDKKGKTNERMARLAWIDERLLEAKTILENGNTVKRAYFDSGSEQSIASILSGLDGGRMPLPLMDMLYAMLQEHEAAMTAKGKSTNRNFTLNYIDHPMRVMESATGEYSQIFKAIFVSPVFAANAEMANHMEAINAELKKTGINASNEAIAFRYAEGKISEEEFERLVPDESEREAIIEGLDVYRKIYDDLIDQINDARKKNGLEPIPYRKNYIHHMSEAKGIIARACGLIGLHISEDTLPTEIAGQTEDLKPRHKWMSAEKARKGDETDYTLRRNTMKYVEDAMKVIYHTSNITRLRQLEGYSDKTVNHRPVMSGVRQYGQMSSRDQRTVDGPNKAFSSLAMWLSSYADRLAGKKVGVLDRAAEKLIGRNGLQVIDGMKRLVGASITALNPTVAASNILPVVDMGSIAKRETFASIGEACDSFFKNKDYLDFEAQSLFLTSRFHGDSMDLNWLDKVENALYLPSSVVDRFSSHVVVRSYYKLGRSKGWSHNVAMEWADEMAWKMMASRKSGEGGIGFDGAVDGALLQFSRESINKIQFLMHDLPQLHGGDEKKILATIASMILGGFVFNWIFGTNTAQEIISPTIESVKEWKPDAPITANLRNTAGNYVEALNPTNLGTGGYGSDGLLDNIPLVSATSDLINGIYSAVDGEGLDELYSAILGFVPGGKTIERLGNGIADLARGYSVDKDGNIKYVLRTDELSMGSVWDVLATLTFGSNKTSAGRAYKAGGYQAMTDTQTEAFHTQKDLGKTNAEAYNAVMGYAEKSGSRNATKMQLPQWATDAKDTEWMKAVLEYGEEAYPKDAPSEYSEEQQAAFNELYRKQYRMAVMDAVGSGGDLRVAADKAYKNAKKQFDK